MKGKIVEAGTDHWGGTMFRVEIGSESFSVNSTEVCIRKLDPGSEVDFISNREKNGQAEIIHPEPQVGCRRERL